jgi:hypothetical protein
MKTLIELVKQLLDNLRFRQMERRFKDELLVERMRDIAPHLR